MIHNAGHSEVKSTSCASYPSIHPHIHMCVQKSPHTQPPTHTQRPHDQDIRQYTRLPACLAVYITTVLAAVLIAVSPSLLTATSDV
mmetsp:Transcript_23064/g.66029  ORF Transcript_23064/g.66029 Transcript_23064/m.66029 type:complete len:86 (-) Transcript_23064:1381-1638(-)